jgi:hypothetical protein
MEGKPDVSGNIFTLKRRMNTNRRSKKAQRGNRYNAGTWIFKKL